ncbi:MAG: 3'-5' exonuclease [Erysipelotrichaceae bacterium]|nr:3'-5' exonuclease [Erysipelotrichaceae bacterium]
MIDINFLNENQKAAVLAEDQYIRIIAGAGSGKTRVLTMRIAHLIQDLNVYPNKILAITFTNKAANEMKQRIKNILQDDNTSCFISTIHSLCVRILREDITSMNYPRNFTVLDADDQKSIIKEAYKELNIDKNKYSMGSLLDYISNNKAAGVSCERAFELAGAFSGEKVKAQVYQFYVERLHQLYALDFDDLLLWTVAMFKKYPEILAKWMKRFHYIHVDEFQDVDHVQYELVRLLTGNVNNLCVVGDPDQTIYTWRGADVNIIMNFERDFVGCRTIILNENYRSTKNILDGANSVIKNNRNRVKKDLYTSQPAAQKIMHYSAPAEEYEASWVANRITQLHKEGIVYRDIAILYRNNYLSRAIEKGLLDQRIPYVIFGGVKFYERQEIKDALSYIRMITTGDDLAFKRIINVPKRGIGNKTIDQIMDQAKLMRQSMYEVCQDPSFLSGKNQKTIMDFVKMVERWKTKAQDMEVSKILEMVLEDSGYRKMLEDEQETDRLENLKELINDMVSFTQEYPESTLDEYLQLVTLYGEKEEKIDDQFVSLMTIHAAKGLEFDHVFVIGMSDGIFPSERSMKDGAAGVEEERRLAYVAYTRARKQLYLTDCSGFSYVLSKPRVTSRFIEEIDLANIEHLNRAKKQEIVVSDDSDKAPKVIKVTQQAYKKGQKVNHAMFGDGIIVKINGNILEVAFAFPHGIKKIVANHPSLKKI